MLSLQPGDAPALDLPAAPQNLPSGVWPADLRALRGVVEKVRFTSDKGDFAVLQLRDRSTGQALVVRGPLAGLHKGDLIQCVGKLEHDSRYGVQFAADAGWPETPTTTAGLTRLLQSGRFPGIGGVLAERIAQALGSEPLQTLRDKPDALQGVRGVPARLQQEVRDGLLALDAAEASWLGLASLGVPPGLCRRLIAALGPAAVRLVRDRPWTIAERVRGIGFAQADRLALDLGFAVDHPERVLAATRRALADLAGNGHTAPPVVALADRVATLLQPLEARQRGEPPTPVSLDAVLQQLQTAGEVRLDAQRVGLPALYDAESFVAEALLARLARPPQPHHEAAAAGLVRAEAALGFALEGRQREAVALALRAPLVVITGGPGTGKTTILRGLLAALGGGASAPRLALAAPTGRAARRLAESTGKEAKTLHRLLDYEPHNEAFARNAETPLELDWLVVDEVSMMEVPLAAALLRALPAHARLVLVGDANQLPSVGPGAFLADLLAAPAVPRVVLEQVFRQGSTSQIPQAAWSVLAGALPQSAQDASGDFYHIVRETPEEIADAVVEVALSRLPRRGFDPVLDVQVLTPMHKGVLGTRQLGERLGRQLRPTQAEALAGGFVAGDKVLQLRNDYDRDIFNGDVGVVMGMGEPLAMPLGTTPTLRVRFGDRPVDLPEDALGDLDLAFAMTVHKSQGSEYPAVVIPIHPSQHLMLQRNLLYTAITRARRFCVVVGPTRAVLRAVQTAAPLQRHTRLASLLGAPPQRDLEQADGG